MLIVDDREMVAESRRHILVDVGIELVALAAWAAGALEEALRHDPDFVVLDSGLPYVDGLTTTSENPARRPDITARLLTGSGTVLDAAECSGVASYLEQTSAVETLVGAVHNVARGELVIGSSYPDRISPTLLDARCACRPCGPMLRPSCRRRGALQARRGHDRDPWRAPRRWRLRPGRPGAPRQDGSPVGLAKRGGRFSRREARPSAASGPAKPKNSCASDASRVAA